MLPITKRRVIHVPHSLATLAAIVALATALGWNAASSDVGDRTAASPSGAAPAERAADTASEPATSADSHRDRRPSVSGLLPLVLPSVSGR
jgi:hypothetical protein